MAMRLNLKAFSPEIPVRDLYPSESLNEVQRRLSHLVEHRGFAIITGEVGVGKTTAVRAFTTRLALGSFLVLYSLVPSSRSPLRPVIEDFLLLQGERIPFNNTAKSMRNLRESLQGVYERNRLPLLIVDDAHLLEPRALLQLKTLTNFQMDSSWPMCLLLVGAPTLTRTLASRELEEIRQRLLFCFPLKGLRKEEMEPYTQTRLNAVGCDTALFPRDILEELHLYSQGNPRLFNQLATFCLMSAASDRKELVDRNCLLQALAEIRAMGTPIGGDGGRSGGCVPDTLAQSKIYEKGDKKL